MELSRFLLSNSIQYFEIVYLLSGVTSDVLSLLALEVYTIFKLIHCLRVCRLPEINPGNPGVSLLSLPESERKEKD